MARPYWFDAAGETRTVTRDVTTLPGRKVVEVSFSGIGQAAREPYPAPDDTTPPTTTVAVTPGVNQAGWSDGPVTLDLDATDDLVGVKEIHLLLDDRAGLTADRALIEPGPHATATLDSEGEYDVSYFAVDLLGNREPVQTVRVGVDSTPPTVSGLSAEPCVIWPPNGRLVTVAQVVGADALSGLADLVVEVTVDEPGDSDVLVDGGTVQVRAARNGHGDGRVYTVTAIVTDAAGNATVGEGTCTVPHDHRGGQHVPSIAFGPAARRRWCGRASPGRSPCRGGARRPGSRRHPADLRRSAHRRPPGATQALGSQCYTLRHRPPH